MSAGTCGASGLSEPGGVKEAPEGPPGSLPDRRCSDRCSGSACARASFGYRGNAASHSSQQDLCLPPSPSHCFPSTWGAPSSVPCQGVPSWVSPLFPVPALQMLPILRVNASSGKPSVGAPQAHTFLPCTPAAPTTQSSLGNQHILACAVFSGGRSSFLKRMLPGASGWPLGTSGSPAKLISVKSCWLTDCGLLFHSQALLLLT